MIDFFGAIGGFIMTPLYLVISGILLGFHKFFSLFLDPSSGPAWAMSIVGLTVLIRAALIPLFVKQIRSSRNMQLLQPKLKELREKYGHDRERFAQEQMKLFKDTGTNPLASCMPILLQMPIFLALFKLLERAAQGETRGLLTSTNVAQLSAAKIFGARIADTFTTDGVTWHVKVLAGTLVVFMTATTFLTQRQLMSKNMPPEALTGQYAKQQKMLLYILPIAFAFGGFAFPIGVLLYWTTTNLWTMCQQFIVIRNSPAPNTEAFRAKQERDARKAAKHGKQPPVQDQANAAAAERPKDSPPPRQQPKRQTRSQRKSRGGSSRPNESGGST